MRGLARCALIGAIVGVYLMQARPAAAVHLFPNFPGDPAGDCGAALEEAPAESAGRFLVEGFFFIDTSDLDSTVEVQAGESVTWQWLKYCHSVTSTSVPVGAEPFSTFGGEPTGPESIRQEVQLVEPEGSKDSYTQTFTVPGTYEFQCVHHASVGMTGVVEVVAAEEDGGDGGGQANGGDGGTSEAPRGGPAVLGQVDVTPVTGGGAAGAGWVLTVLGLLGLRLSRR